MRTQRLTPHRYQLTKEALKIIRNGHPWIFRSKVSTAARSLPNGQWLNLVGPDNRLEGYGIYEAEGLIAIRVLGLGKTLPTLDSLHALLQKAISRRESLSKYTNAFRAIHGENDGLPGIVFDVYDNVGVLQTYTSSVDGLGRWVASVLRKDLSLKSVVWKLPAKRKRHRKESGLRWLSGKPISSVNIHEGKLEIHIDVSEGQKSGAFLDLRGLRKWLSLQKWKGKRVLNLFSYTGTLGLSAEAGGAAEIWNVDISKKALEAARKYHARNPKCYQFIEADVFEWLKRLPPKQQFDLIIVDPPLMASLMTQVPQALKTYQRLYGAALSHLGRGGCLIACCCTSRISRSQFEKLTKQILSPRLKLKRSLSAEDDHPVGFSEGDYLKLLIFQ